MIDIQRLLDARIFRLIVFGVICGVAGALITAVALALHKHLTAKEIADRMFGELQREHAALLGMFSQAKMTIECLESKVAVATGCAAATVERAKAMLEGLEE